MKKKIFFFIAALFAFAISVNAQVAPFNSWRTLSTQHFKIHFTPPLEEQARRAAVNAENAYAKLAKELMKPRGPIHIIVSDDVDYSNGYATVSPVNKIVVYAHPPVEGFSLRNYDDWNNLVITHELTHIFHLDRTRGWWKVGQAVLGRNPLLFPNTYSPAWLTEGLAVYYESKLTQSGRLKGSEHYMIARAAAMSQDLPHLNQLSLVSSRFPGGSGVYVYGSLLVDYIARTRGEDKVRDLVDRSAGQPIPFMVNRAAKGAFGVSFEQAWRKWADSLMLTSNKTTSYMGWRELTREGYYTQFPRWLGDTAIMYVANTGKDVTSLYSVTLDGRNIKLGRRNTLDANVKAPDGSIIYAQQDLVNRTNVRSDLYIQRNGHEFRLTNGARLSAPDVRWDGSIVAVQATPASTRIVRVSPDGKTIIPLTEGTKDIQWSDPRWSPDGTHITGTWINRGCRGITILDTLGRDKKGLINKPYLVSSPSWSGDGKRIVYSSELEGRSQIFITEVDKVFQDHAVRDDIGAFQPVLSPKNDMLAAVVLRSDGYHIALASTRERLTGLYRGYSTPDSAGYIACPKNSETPEPVSVKSYTYNPFSTLLPRYWAPTFTFDGNGGVAFGALTSGADIIGRHSYSLNASYNSSRDELSGYFGYRYARFKQPVFDLSLEQNWAHPASLPGIKRRNITYSLMATLMRPRYRTFSSLSLGAEYEVRHYTPVDVNFRYPAFVATGSWSNTKFPTLAISPEDGIAVRATSRYRWREGVDGSGFTTISGSTTLYKSLDLPGYAHHVLVLRTAGAFAGKAATTGFSTGGISGGSLELFPGYYVGDQQRTFPVRGFPSSTQSGTRALGANFEYRAPLTFPTRGLGALPIFLNKTSLAVFTDAARAYCPAAGITTPFCTATDIGNPWIASAGAELNLDTALQFDVPYRFRLGVAAPIANGKAFGVTGAQVYVTLGSSL